MHPAVANTDYSWMDVWPRRQTRAASLPPGQGLVRAFPRFADNPRTPPPTTAAEIQIRITGAVNRSISIGLDALIGVTRVKQTSNFHCVTTWSVTDLHWTGWSLADLWHKVIVPTADPAPGARWLVAGGLDGYRAKLHLGDALGDDVLIVDTLEGQPLEVIHGAPLRLLSPSQYGYKSVKHLSQLEVHLNEPPSALGAREHPRGRVALEERHSKIPAWLLRWPYRIVIPPTALIAKRSAQPVNEAGSLGSGIDT